MLQYLPRTGNGALALPQVSRASIEASRNLKEAPRRARPVSTLSADAYWAKVKNEIEDHRRGADERNNPTSLDIGSIRVADLLNKIRESLRPLSLATGRKIELDLRDGDHEIEFKSDFPSAIQGLLEQTMSVGHGPIRITSMLCEQMTNDKTIAIEIHDDVLEVSDMVRRKLSKAVIAQYGETSFVSARTGSCVRIRLPMTAAESLAPTTAGAIYEDLGETVAGKSDPIAAKSVSIGPNEIDYVTAPRDTSATSRHIGSSMQARLDWERYERFDYTPRY